MDIELSGTVRGEEVAVRWRDGRLTGSDVLLDRLEPLLAEGRFVVDDLSSIIRGLEFVAAQRLRLRVLDERDRQPVGAAAA